MPSDVLHELDHRLGRVHARQRLGLEHDHEEHVFGRGLNFFHLENWYSVHAFMRGALRLTGLYWRGRTNSERIRIRHNRVALHRLPATFEGFTILQVSDMHVDMNAGVMARLIELLPELTYDICVLTGDFRGRTYGPFDATLEGLARVCRHFSKPVYGVLGNHDTVRMVPGLEAMGIRMLINESERVVRGHDHIHIAGVDDAHYYRAENLEKARASISPDECAILLSHTPEIYRQAAHSEFGLMLSGHTHGGQVCLPGSIPITLDAALPRRMGSGPWRYHNMAGYTSVGVGASIVPVRFNCPPEITLHRLDCAPANLQP